VCGVEEEGCGVERRGVWCMEEGVFRVEEAACEQLHRRNVKQFRGGLVFKADRLLYHSTLGLRVIKKKKKKGRVLSKKKRVVYRGASLIRNRPPLGPYSRDMPRALWWS